MNTDEVLNALAGAEDSIKQNTDLLSKIRKQSVSEVLLSIFPDELKSLKSNVSKGTRTMPAHFINPNDESKTYRMAHFAQYPPDWFIGHTFDELVNNAAGDELIAKAKSKWDEFVEKGNITVDKKGKVMQVKLKPVR